MQGSAISCHKDLDEKLEAITHGRGVVSKLYRLLSLPAPIAVPRLNCSGSKIWELICQHLNGMACGGTQLIRANA